MRLTGVGEEGGDGEACRQSAREEGHQGRERGKEEDRRRMEREEAGG
jgi:hypothetical protein